MVQNQRRLYAGLLFIAFGLAGVYFARNLQFGTADAMGPGFLPTICAWLIVALGSVVATRGFFESAEAIDAFIPRPVLMIALSVGIFAVLVERAGLAITVFITAFVASYAGPAKFLETIVLGLVAAVATVIVFVMLLGLNIPAWPDLP